ncbi:MAG TPA: iron-containing alcohol dehydrogenase family protein [Stellaceae bacterium]|nr:iron-containing alcohol dehydrogenase family protein [Stellaceae bacterium]
MTVVIAEHWPKRLMMGRGAVAQLPGVVAALGASRALVICGRTIGRSPLLAAVQAALGSHFVGLFDQVTSHTPLTLLEATVGLVRSLGADVLVTIGGGSAIDAGKGTALLMAAGESLEPYTLRYDEAGQKERRLLGGATIPHIAIPTTHGSASEVMPTAGIRDTARRYKMLFWDDALVPDAVILDPEMTGATGPVLSAASGMTAVARCIEALYSRHRNPLSEGLALHALRLLNANLPRVVADGGDLDARFHCQVACTMSGVATINAMASIVHALGHVVGGRYALQHGVSHSVLLVPAMRRLLPVIGDGQRLVLEALGGAAAGSADAAGIAAGERIAELVARLPLRRRLREIGIPPEELPIMAQEATQDYMMANLPLPMRAPDIEALLREAW